MATTQYVEVIPAHMLEVALKVQQMREEIRKQTGCDIIPEDKRQIMKQMLEEEFSGPSVTLPFNEKIEIQSAPYHE